jgi:hypothetical protein
MNVYKKRIKQGVLWVVANNNTHAKQQARALERDLQRYWVRQTTEYRQGVFCLGQAAKVQIGVA